jgi:hypothetical protein
MKKLLLTLVPALVFVMGTGCAQSSILTSNHSTSSSTPETPSIEEYRRTPDTLTWKASDEVQKKIVTALKSGKKIREIMNPRKLIIPSDIYPPQFVKFLELGDIQFGIVQRLGGVVLGMWDQNTTHSSGIWYADKNDTTWKPLITLSRVDQNSNHNNIFDFWNEGTELYLLLVDSYGAGSGEGTAKVLISSSGDKQWQIRKCFAFANGEFHELQKKFNINRIHDAIPQWLKNPGGLNNEYIFNSSTDKFEIYYFNETTKKSFNSGNANDDCQNVVST